MDNKLINNFHHVLWLINRLIVIDTFSITDKMNQMCFTCHDVRFCNLSLGISDCTKVPNDVVLHKIHTNTVMLLQRQMKMTPNWIKKQDWMYVSTVDKCKEDCGAWTSWCPPPGTDWDYLHLLSLSVSSTSLNHQHVSLTCCPTREPCRETRRSVKTSLYSRAHTKEWPSAAFPRANHRIGYLSLCFEAVWLLHHDSIQRYVSIDFHTAVILTVRGWTLNKYLNPGRERRVQNVVVPLNEPGAEEAKTGL